MLHVSVPSPFHLRSVRMVCVHTVRRVQSPSRIARDRRPAIISIKYAAPFRFLRDKLASIALMLDEEEKNAARSDKRSVHVCGFTSVSEAENQKANTRLCTKNSLMTK